MRKIKLDRYYIVRDFTPAETLRILKLIKGIDVTDIDSLAGGIKRVRKVVRIATKKRFKCNNKQLIEAFLKVIELLPVQAYYEITQITKNLEKIRQK